MKKNQGKKSFTLPTIGKKLIWESVSQPQKLLGRDYTDSPRSTES